MSRFQSNTIFSSIFIAVLWFLFCTVLIDIDVYVWVLWALASIFIGLWIGWQQKWIWFVWIVFAILTAISFVFSIIPVYTHIPNLDVFYASQIPNIQCNAATQWNINIWDKDVSMQDVCTRWSYPILANQTIKNNTDSPLLISLSLWESIYLWASKTAKIQRNTSWYILAWENITPNTILTTDQITLQNDFQQQKNTYLRTNFWWKREYAPSITTISLRKMRLMSLIDRRYTNWISWLEFYMQEIAK
jgi:hypothetical protein